MSATVDIQTNYQKDILTIPIQAVTTRADSVNIDKSIPKDKVIEEKLELKEIVFLLVDGKAIKREVVTGIQDDKFIQIIEGLEESDEIITAPYSAISRKLKDEKEVEKVEKDELFSDKK